MKQAQRESRELCPFFFRVDFVGGSAKRSHTQDDFMESAFFTFLTGWDGGAFPTMSDDGLVCFPSYFCEIKKYRKRAFFFSLSLSLDICSVFILSLIHI